MNQRRLFREAISVYEEAREQFGDANLFAFEIANNYLAVADFEPAIERVSGYHCRDSRRTSLIQRQLLNYDERHLYDTAILLTEERLARALGRAVIPTCAYRDFLIWVTMERGLYRRALAAARTLERHTGNEHHAMFRIGRELRSRSEFELAEQAFRYYLELETHPLQSRSYEELSRTYLDWAGYLTDRNLDFDGAADSLYRKAFETVELLTGTFPALRPAHADTGHPVGAGPGSPQGPGEGGVLPPENGACRPQRCRQGTGPLCGRPSAAV
jgi:tetratricopeptide (TPR) repeat protein